MGITSHIYYTFSRPLFFVSQSDNLSLPFHCRLPSFFLEMPAQYFLCTYICMYILLFSILSSRFSVLRTSYLSFCLCLSPFLFSYSPFYISIHHVCFPICFLVRLSARFLPFLYTSTFPSSLLLFTLYINAPTPNFYTSSYLHMYHVHLIVYIIYIYINYTFPGTQIPDSAYPNVPLFIPSLVIGPR